MQGQTANIAQPAMGWGTRIVIAICAITAIGATIGAARYAPSLGWPALLLMIGLAATALIGAFALIIAKPLTRSDVVLGDNQILAASAFSRLTLPLLITREGKAVFANEAYYDLARSLGALGLSESAPTVDRLFGTKVKSTSAIIFKLHQIRHADESATEHIDHVGPDGKMRRFCVDVRGLPEGQLWQITDVTGDSLDKVEALSQAPIGLFACDPDGQVLALNKALTRWIGMEPGRVPEHLSEFVEDPSALLGAPRETGRIIRNETRLLTRKGLATPAVMSAIWCELDNGEPYISAALYGHATSPAAAYAQIAAQQKTQVEAAQTTSPQVRADWQSAAPFGVARLSGEVLQGARIEEANAAFIGMCGGQVQIGDQFAAIFDTKATPPLFFDADHELVSSAYEATLKGKTERPINAYFWKGEGEFFAYILDVSARKDLETQLFQSQKMQAIGQLAGGVAHDFNNLLTAIRLNTDELLGRHPVGDPSYPELQKINSTVTRAAGLVKKLLAFSRKQTLRTHVLDITDTLSDMFVLLRQVMVERVKLDMVHGRNLPNVKADKTQIETVMVNLCVNARDALEEKGGGEITISTHAADADELRARGVSQPRSERFVRIDVTDNGIGMSKELQNQIFDPFFTTKDQGKGTGLGLATVYGIVEQSQGHLTVDSTEGVGTTFSIYLPATDAAPTTEEAVSLKAKIKSKPSDLAGTGTILFVEDEESVRLIAAKTLRKRGYTVIEAGDGEEALEAIKSGEHKFDLMISDVVMPVMDGPTLLRKSKDLLGDARIVFISGYAQEEFSDILSEHPDLTFLPKPFTLTQLAQRVKEELTPDDED